MDASDIYVKTAPSQQNAIDIFKGAWASGFPAWAKLHGGPFPLFEDHRIEWFVNQMGGVRNRRILELGPLEGAHTYMLEKSGAREIVAVEANQTAYLRCLITKEIFNLNRARFLLGDLNAYMESTEDRFDACVASGVLYHMTAPIHTLELIARTADALFLWTHYYDENYCSSLPRFPLESQICDWRGLQIAMHRHNYEAERGGGTFYGGTASHSMWLEKSSIELVLRELGFRDIREADLTPDHPNGPAVSFFASRPDRPA